MNQNHRFLPVVFVYSFAVILHSFSMPNLVIPTNFVVVLIFFLLKDVLTCVDDDYPSAGGVTLSGTQPAR